MAAPDGTILRIRDASVFYFDQSSVIALRVFVGKPW
jgi:hypothetical protein